MYVLSGITIAEGSALAKAVVIENKSNSSFYHDHESIDAQAEIALYKQRVKDFAHRLHQAITGPAPDGVRDLLGAASGFLSDKQNEQEIVAAITHGSTAAEAARDILYLKLQHFINVDDADMKKLARELSSLSNEFIASLKHEENSCSIASSIVLQERSIIITKAMTPAAFLCLRTDLVAGVVLEDSAPSGHLGTVLRELRIPSLFAVNGASNIKDGEMVLVDASQAQIIVNPPQDGSTFLNNDFSDDDNIFEGNSGIAVTPSIGAARDFNREIPYVEHGIGLLRSEFLFLGNEIEPSEEEMIASFKPIFDKVAPSAPINARTFDFAGDKKPNFKLELDDTGPLVGYGANVGTRLLRTEIRALLQAACGRSITIVYPLIVRESEAQYLYDLSHEVKTQLEQEGKPCGELEIALMIETPAAIFTATAFAKFSQKFILGTSSLAHYACAPRPYDHSFNPPLAKMIALACKAASDNNIDLTIAGRFAHRLELLPLFIGLGASEVIVDSYSLPRIKEALNRLNVEQKQSLDPKLFHELISLNTGEELSQLFKRLKQEG